MKGLASIVGLLLILAVGCSDGDETSQEQLSKATKLPMTKVVNATNPATLPAMDHPKLIRMATSDPIALLELAVKRYEDMPVKDYTCTFTKLERVKGRLRKKEVIDVKFRASPFSVAMKWKENPAAGDIVVYVEGKYKDKDGKSRMVVHPTSKFLSALTGGSVLRLPTSEDALKHNLEPITRFGIYNEISDLLMKYKLAKKHNEGQHKFMGLAEINGHKCIVMELRLPVRKEYESGRTVACFDIERLLPRKVIEWGWDKKFHSLYQYDDVEFNVDLTDDDFTPKANGIKGRD